jgi:molybdenum cofactor synthesis domain-containing protein
MKPERFTVVSVNISEQKGTAKRAVPEITIDADGVVGDAHAGPGCRQVSVLSAEIIADFEKRTGRKTRPGEFAENITTRGLDLRRVGLLDSFEGDTVKLLVSKIGKPCHPDGCAIFREVGECVMPKEGVFCQVISPGSLRAGQVLLFRPRELCIRVITLSDRASRGQYEDRAGPRIKQLLEDFLASRRWHPEIESVLLPDEPELLKVQLQADCTAGVDVIFTTGSTGIGPRDIAPDVVGSLADKIIPGITEYIRTKFAEQNPHALLSRSIVAVIGRTLVYSLPGSVRAVEEYIPEILKTFEHLILILHSVDAH